MAGASFGAFVAGGAPAGLPSCTFGANPLFVGMMWVSFVVAFLVPVGLIALGALLWKRRAGSVLFRIYVSAYVLAAIGFAILLDHWNVLGFRY